MKTALVTGANKGIGHEVARQLMAKGFHVFVGARNRGAGGVAADAIAKNGGKPTFLEIDVADNASVTAAAREFSKIADHLDVLVNNAGIVVDGDSVVLEISDELLRKTLETITLGALRVTRAFAPLLAKSKKPRVINVSSGGGQLTGGCGRLGVGLLHLEDCAQRRYVATRGGTAEICGEFCLPGLGADRHGRQKRNPLGGTGRGHDRLAPHRCAAEAYRQILA